ncbi:MAG: hypothetical protein IH614_09015 [Desulfuromonadales bacterium]|nr:hypothetical protein [Desulfuromonadales bacterium]
MPAVVAAATAFPPFVATQEQVREVARSCLPGLEESLPVFDRSRVQRRHFMRPLDWYLQPRPFAERNGIYLQEGTDLLERAARRCLGQAGLPPERLDMVIAVSSSGFATPSLDARLISRLGRRPQTVRLPIWGLGCAAGAAGLARAADYALGHPQAVVLVAALECCSLTFLHDDLSKKNLIAAAIFADGAAAALVAGSQSGLCGPRLTATGSHLFPASDRVMGWDFLDRGMQLVLSPRLPAIVREQLAPLVDHFLAGSGLSRRQLVHYLTHPGGARVIDAYRQALGLTDEQLELTEAVLREHGNISSVSVLAVLERWLASERCTRSGPGLLSAFGPGFSAEMVLLEV